METRKGFQKKTIVAFTNSTVFILDSLYCGKWGEFLNAFSDLDLDPMKLNTELLRAIFIYYNVFQFHVPRSISF